MPEVTLTLTTHDFDTLWTNAMMAFLHEQWDRFEHDHPELVTADDNSSTMLWFDTAADTFLAQAWLRAAGHTSYRLWDAADDHLSGYVLYIDGWTYEAFDQRHAQP